MNKGEHFVIQKGKAQCDKGNKFPNFKVSSHAHHYWNNKEGDSDYLAVTEDDTQFDPPVQPFGTCSLKNGNSCSFSPAGKWTKTYDKVKVMDKKCVIESSELKCTTGGKITVMTHGQQAEITPRDLETQDPEVMRQINPLVDIEDLLNDELDYI